MIDVEFLWTTITRANMPLNWIYLYLFTNSIISPMITTYWCAQPLCKYLIMCFVISPTSFECIIMTPSMYLTFLERNLDLLSCWRLPFVLCICLLFSHSTNYLFTFYISIPTRPLQRIVSPKSQLSKAVF